MTLDQAVHHLTARLNPPQARRQDFRYIKQSVNAAVADLGRTLGVVALTVAILDADGKAQQLNYTASGKAAEHRQWRSVLFRFLPELANTYGFKRIQVSFSFANGFNGKRCWPRYN